MILLCVSILAILASGLYLYFNQILNNGLIFWTIPIVLIISWIASLVVFVIILLLTSLFHNKNKLLIKSKKFYSFWVFHIARFLRGFFRIKVIYEGLDLLPKSNNFLLVLNHQSMFDSVAALSMFKGRPITFIIKDSLLKIPLIGRFFVAAGFLPINRTSNRKGLEAIAFGVKRLKQGCALGIYPEGKRSKSKELGEFRNGAFKLAVKAEVPIVVMAVDGFYRNDLKVPLKKSKTLIKVCKVLEYEEFKDLHTNEIGDIVKKTIEDNLDVVREKYTWL